MPTTGPTESRFNNNLQCSGNRNRPQWQHFCFSDMHKVYGKQKHRRSDDPTDKVAQQNVNPRCRYRRQNRHNTLMHTRLEKSTPIFNTIHVWRLTCDIFTLLHVSISTTITAYAKSGNKNSDWNLKQVTDGSEADNCRWRKLFGNYPSVDIFWLEITA